MIIKLKKIRKEKNISLRRLETLSGISYSEINRIENGEIQPTILTLCCIAKALGVTLCSIVSCDNSE
jgi:transcriptional regulator with XRE-family HTH domain